MHPDEMTWITENLAITNFCSAHDKAVLTEHRVKAVLCLVAAYLTKTQHMRASAALALVQCKRESAVAVDLVPLIEMFEDA
jgi:hypothetical protein